MMRPRMMSGIVYSFIFDTPRQIGSGRLGQEIFQALEGLRRAGAHDLVVAAIQFRNAVDVIVHERTLAPAWASAVEMDRHLIARDDPGPERGWHGIEHDHASCLRAGAR